MVVTPHTHTGAFDSFQRTPSGFKLGLEHEEKASQTTQQ